MGTVRLSRGQALLLTFLQERELRGETCTVQSMVQATGLKADTLRTYIGKDYLDAFLHEKSPGTYSVKGASKCTPREFLAAISQSSAVRELGHGLENRLARSLVRRSRDNMVLALEVYNRPSLENRLDSFVLLFSTSWEQLLKARLLEHSGENSIFRQPRPGKARETIAFRECVARLYPNGGDSIRKNLERIQDLRDNAAHLLLPELQPIASRLFQAGVLNYAEAFQELTGQSFLPRTSVGLLTLVADVTEPTVARLQSTYGKDAAAEVVALITTLSEELEKASDRRFAIGVEYNLVFAKNPSEADIMIARGQEAPTSAVVIHKAVDIEHSHPFLPSDCVRVLNERLLATLPDEDRLRLFSVGERMRNCLNSHDLEAMLQKEGWKNVNSHFHHFIRRPPTHRYSGDAMEYLLERLTTDPTYLDRARTSLKHSRTQVRRGTA